ncbi:hypothetical protein O6H91_21G067600 [Diphasiastrum complanatum]|uniref:Uncharacterized protein n=1 Tax=Diphasiastrum complanatum TaxID=34168 RepID=A0ACC2AN56_DIPCM|nr:hypothetical protein O6H91_21G067600 [Diphasiastrum complanatum]
MGGPGMATDQGGYANSVGVDPHPAYLRGSLKVQDFVWPEDERPDVPFDSFDGEDAFPVVDLSLLLSSDPRDTDKLVKEMAAAAADWGFFRIVNHGVSLELVAKVEALAHEFFQLPSSQKLLVARNSDLPFGYSGSEIAVRIKNWTETLQLIWGKELITKIAEKVWTSESERQRFINIVEEYCVAMGNLSKLLLELLLQGLGLEATCLNQHFGPKSVSTLRLNFYPPCPQPDLTFGTQPHADYGVLSILYQDSIGGLQVLKRGRWVSVKPQAGSFIVNIGDCLQVWSDCKYQSVLHRAVVNNFAARLSMPFFYNPLDEAVISPLQILVDKSHRAKYKPFTWADYRKQFELAKARKHSPTDFYKI